MSVYARSTRTAFSTQDSSNLKQAALARSLYVSDYEIGDNIGNGLRLDLLVESQYFPKELAFSKLDKYPKGLANQLSHPIAELPYLSARTATEYPVSYFSLGDFKVIRTWENNLSELPWWQDQDFSWLINVVGMEETEPGLPAFRRGSFQKLMISGGVKIGHKSGAEQGSRFQDFFDYEIKL